MNKPILDDDVTLSGALPVQGPALPGAGAGARPAKAEKHVPLEINRRQARMLAAAAARSVAANAALDAEDPFRTKVLPLFYKHRADYLALARRVALELHRKLGRPVTVDDVRLVAPPKPVDPDAADADWDGRVMGAIFIPSEWTWVAFIRSDRKTCHKRTISSFVPVEA